MLRRRLFAYTIMLAAGIASAYLFFESLKCLPVAGLMVSLAVSACLVMTGSRNPKKDKKIMILCLLAGFLIFSFRYACFNLPLSSEAGAVETTDVRRIEGEIISVSEKGDGIRIVIQEESVKCAGRIMVSYYGDINGEVYDLYGMHATAYGELREPASAENPGCFNYRTYLRGKGIRYTFAADYIKFDSTRAPGPLMRYRSLMMKTRDEFLALFTEDNGVRGFLKGVVFGDKSDIDEETISDFNNNSTGHILAVSGLHVGFLFSLLRMLTGKKRNRLTALFIIAVLLMYGEMTCWSASTVRAVTVTGISLISMYAGRPFDLLSSVSAAAFIILCANPYQLFSSGFQLSFIALIGMSFASVPLGSFFGNAVSGILSVQLAVAPLLAFTFNRINFLSIFINIPVVFMASLLVPVCISVLFISLAAGGAPVALVTLTEGISELLVMLNRMMTFGSGEEAGSIDISMDAIVLFYLALFILTSEWLRVRVLRKEYLLIAKTAALLVVPVICISAAFYNPYLNDNVVFVSVGQGDCTHVREADCNVLIDGGGSSYYNVGKNTLKPYLIKNGAENLDMALLTHLHTDHFKGIQELEEIYPVAATGLSAAYEKSVAESGEIQGEKVYLRAGDIISMGEDVSIEVIWPCESQMADLSTDDENENNMVYIIHCGGVKVLVTGDLLEADEDSMIEYYRGTDTLKCDVLRVGHHGSNTSTGEAFLDAVDPQIAVISVGAYNTYGHPTQQTLDRLETHGISVFRTDVNGAVGLDISDGEIRIDTMR